MVHSATACLALSAALAGLTGPAPSQPASEPKRPASIAWRPFAPEAFEAAGKEGKLVLLSITAPWGHWDRVMSEATFTDPDVARLANEKFIPVQVDALLRPDIFARYGMGGWPTTTFLLPSGQPLYFPDASRRLVKAGGTFYAAEPMAAYLRELADYFPPNREAASRTANEISEAMLKKKEVGSTPLKPEMIEAAVTSLLEAFARWRPDPEIKEPHHPDVDSALLAMDYYVRRGNRDVLDTALRTLTEMARGGIHDQIGGGFHRYAVDAAWRMPAFEKPLLTNAEMLQAYNDIYKLSVHGRFLEIAQESLDWIQSTLRDPEGWYYAYQAADAALGDDGDYYTWTLEEAKAALTEQEQAIVLPCFDIGEWGEMVNSAPRRNVLFMMEGPVLLAERLGMEEKKVREILDAGRRRLLEARSRRTAPPVGRILVAEPNAAIATALIQAGDAWKRPEVRQAGLTALDRLWEKTHDTESGLLSHAWRPGEGKTGEPRFFADQAQTARALVAAYESTGEARYLTRARDLSSAADGRFSDALNGGWMDATHPSEAPGLLSWPVRSLRDNALFAETLWRIARLSGRSQDELLATAARKGLESWADEFSSYKTAASPFGLAAGRLLHPPLEIFILGSAGEPGYDDSAAQARALYHPWKLTRHLPLQEAGPALSARKLAAPAGPGVLLCQAERCAGPYPAGENLRAKLEEFLGEARKAP